MKNCTVAIPANPGISKQVRSTWPVGREGRDILVRPHISPVPGRNGKPSTVTGPTASRIRSPTRSVPSTGSGRRRPISTTVRSRTCTLCSRQCPSDPRVSTSGGASTTPSAWATILPRGRPRWTTSTCAAWVIRRTQMPAFQGGFKLDTALRGNRNTGHEFNDGPHENGIIGPKLTREERCIGGIPKGPMTLPHMLPRDISLSQIDFRFRWKVARGRRHARPKRTRG